MTLQATVFSGIVVGFATLVVGALLNAQLNRQRDDRLRKEEANAIAIALRSELQIIHTSLIENAKALRESPDVAKVGPDVAHMIRVFPHALPKLGLLQKEAISALITTYTLMEQYGEDLLLLAAIPKKLESGRQLFVIPPEACGDVAELSDALAGDLQKAISQLSKQLGDEDKALAFNSWRTLVAKARKAS